MVPPTVCAVVRVPFSPPLCTSRSHHRIAEAEVPDTSEPAMYQTFDPLRVPSATPPAVEELTAAPVVPGIAGCAGCPVARHVEKCRPATWLAMVVLKKD